MSVVHDRHQDVLVLRSDHSLLGGIHLRSNETIYGIFNLMEAMRLAHPVPEGHSPPRRALIMYSFPFPSSLHIDVDVPFSSSSGLGVGITATALQALGCVVDAVEIDDVVLQYARQYFHYSNKHGLDIVGDGRAFVDGLCGNGTRGRYDYIAHDVFSGGSVPQQLFSEEVFDCLKLLMKPDGVLALNYPGQVNSLTTQSVAKTLKSSFSHVRAFGDEFEKAPFRNMVFFASPSALNFRAPLKSEFMGSQIRENELDDFQEREITPSLVDSKGEESAIIFTDYNNNLAKLQQVMTDGHALVMDQILPHEFWARC